MTSLEENIRCLLKAKNIPFTDFQLQKIQGEASYRVYYRLALDGGRSFIVMQMPAGKSSASEEITNAVEKPAEPPFLIVARYLSEKSLPVPDIAGHDLAQGLILIEDLGDETFEKRILVSSDADRELWYQRAIELLLKFQKETHQTEDHFLHRRSFDATLLNWEFEHFFEYGIEVRLDRKINPEDRAALQAETSKITNTLIAAPQVLVHRDFQSRNLMAIGDNLKLLDFQDALRGPLPYDLVALLRDSYIALDVSLRERLIRYYVERMKAALGFEMPLADFTRLFDLMTLQRKLKDAGRFVYIDRVKGNPNFLKHIPDSLAYVRETFERLPEYTRLLNLLKKYVPEFN